MTSETVHLLKAVHPAQPMLFPCSKETNTLEMNRELQTQSGWGWGNRTGAYLLQAANPITVISHLTEKAKPELRASLAYFSPVRLNSPHRLPLLSVQNHGAARDLSFQVCMVMGTRCNSLCAILWFFLAPNCTDAKHGESLGPEGRIVSASSNYQSYSTRHLSVGSAAGGHGQMDRYMARRWRRKGKELKSDMKREIMMKVKRSSREGEPGLRNSVGSPMPYTFLGKIAWGKGFLEVGNFDKKCSSPISRSCGNVFSLLAVLPQVRTADANSKRAIKLHAG